ncbi:MAG: DUF2961 domain-containing protein, partial [Candidatus Omnitrophica bacterium]|nr:DUF2961 domain-containing protein [Candidatus Omnitrophota bacterium]
MTSIQQSTLGLARISRLSIAVAVLAASLGARGDSAAAPALEPRVLGIEELFHLDQLPRLKSSIEVGCVSSWDRTGGNDDGFTGKYSFIRKEPDGLVIADLQGPGVIYRIHTPSPTDETIEFFFDGEAEPRISLKISELFDGHHAPFLAPLVGGGVGGRYSYVPLAYQKSCKVLVKTKTFHFYQINYARFPENCVLPSYTNPPSDDFMRGVEKAAALLRQTGADISSYLVPEGTHLETKTVNASLAPGNTVPLFESSNPGRILGLKVRPASALAGKDRAILIRMTWDGAPEPAVLCPAGDFFGASFGDPAVHSLLLGTSNDTDYAYFPMPYEHSARIELVSERTSGPAIEVQAQVTFAQLGKAADEGRFYAHWHRENPTREGIA